MERLSGLPAARVIGQAAPAAFGDGEVLRRVLAGESVRSDERPYRVPETGREGTFEGSYFPVRDGSGMVVGGMAVIREVTELARRKDEFLAMLGHELRNPLGAIRTALQVVDHPATTPAEATRQRVLIDRQMRHLARLVDDLLDVSRVMSGRIVLERQRLDLNDVARTTLLALRPDARAERREVSFADRTAAIEVIGDPARLEQVLFKLLDNALKYTPAGGRIEMAVERRGDQGVVRVADTGIGIPPEDLPRVFDLFMQGGATLARSRGGLGLGLTLVRRLIEMHGGTVTARSEGVGRGTEFMVALPLAPSDAAPAPRDVARAPGSSRRVLVIEDNPDAREAMRALLELWGHSVELAEDGPRGFEIALASRPDVVVVDIGLPGLDGYHVAHGIRAALRERAVFLIALTGFGQPDDRRRALDAGFDVHLVKPVNPEALSAALSQAPAHGGR